MNANSATAAISRSEEENIFFGSVRLWRHRRRRGPIGKVGIRIRFGSSNDVNGHFTGVSPIAYRVYSWDSIAAGAWIGFSVAVPFSRASIPLTSSGELQSTPAVTTASFRGGRCY